MSRWPRYSGIVLATVTMVGAWLYLQYLAHAPVGTSSTTLRAVVREVQLADGPTVGPGPIQLPDYLDRSLPGESGTATYLATFDRSWPAAEPTGLFIPWSGSSYEVRLNGLLIAVSGRLTEPDASLAKRPYYVAVPLDLLRERGNTLAITIATRAYTRAGLLPMTIGPAHEVYRAYQRAFLIRVVGPMAVTVISLVLGGIALLIWWRQRDPMFGLYGLAEIAWSVRLFDYFLDDAAMPAALRGYLVAASREVFLGAIARLSLLVIRVPWRWLHRTLDAYLWLALPVIAPLTALSSHPLIFPLSWTIKVGIVLTVTVSMVWAAIHRPSRDATVLATTIGLSAALFVVDWAKVWWTGDYYWVHSMTRYVSVPFSLVMAWMLVERYSSAVDRLRRSNEVLAERVAEREAELHAVFARAQQAAAEQTALEERSRILRDMHDGLGSQLVSTLSLVESGKAAAPDIARQLRGVLDSLKLSIDAMQDTGGDLAAVLGNLRYRLGRRIADAGIQINWNVERLPTLPDFTVRKVQELQFLLLEGITNVLQHAQATTITVSAHADTERGVICIGLADDGRGFDVDATRGGRGLRNMQVRATAMGAMLTIRSVPGHTVITLDIPLPR